VTSKWTPLLFLIAGLLLPSCGGGGGSSSGGTGTTPGDTTRPVVVATNPSHNAIAVPVNTTVTATFSEAVDPATPASAFTVLQGTAATPGTVSFLGTSATFTPAAKLGNKLTYTATLSTGIKDLAGNSLASPFTWTFITSDCNTITLAKQFSLGAVVGSTGFKALATDGASVYLWTQAEFTSTYGTLFRIDPANGQILSTTNIPLVAMSPSSPANGIQFIADITWHQGALWASGTYIGPGGSFPQGVFRVNLATGLAETPIPVSAGVAGEVTILQGLASDGTNLYVALDRTYYTPPAPPAEHLIVKFNPAASAQVPLSPALLTTTGQATRLDYGGGSLWVFNNPDFQKADPTSGAVQANYCKTDGGANILYLNGSIWSIKDTILMSYSLP